eukprot:4500315-Pyramimonas_sp.AAC.1
MEALAMAAILVILLVVVSLAVFGKWLNARGGGLNPRFQQLHRVYADDPESEMGPMMRRHDSDTL